MSHDLWRKVRWDWGPWGVVPEGTNLKPSAIYCDCCKTSYSVLQRLIALYLTGWPVDVTNNFSFIKPLMKVQNKQ